MIWMHELVNEADEKGLVAAGGAGMLRGHIEGLCFCVVLLYCVCVCFGPLGDM